MIRTSGLFIELHSNYNKNTCTFFNLDILQMIFKNKNEKQRIKSAGYRLLEATQ